jgi:N-acetylmuramoyl-L-alanine amidase
MEPTEKTRGGCGSCVARIASVALLVGGLLAAWVIVSQPSSRGPGMPGLVQALFGASRPRVGIVAGHWGSDVGAVCDDGLQEVDVNLRIARETKRRLERAGYQVDLMEEFAEELQGYKADAFVSIHADSCVDLSGFKVARLAESGVPQKADRLVQCLYAEYGQATGLAPHFNTITYDMTEYHAFLEIDASTPGAIIEAGFLGGDRALLTDRPGRVAAGIEDAILCYMAWAHPTPTPPPTRSGSPK